MRIINRRALTVLMSAGAMCGGFVSAEAQVQNGGFEDPVSFNHWVTIGYTAVVDSSFGITAPDPTHVGLAGTDNFNPPVPSPASPSSLESFLGLSSGSLDAVGNGPVAEGSAFKQTFTVNAGDVLTFQWKFLTNEFAGDPTDDFAFFTIDGGSGAALTKLSDINDGSLGLSASPLDVSYGFETPFGSINHTFLTSGTVTLGFGVVDVNGIDVSSAIAIDSVQVRPNSGPTVPEPGALASLSACGFAAMIALRRKRRRA